MAADAVDFAFSELFDPPTHETAPAVATPHRTSSGRLDFGDAPDATVGDFSYPTRLEDDGARHRVVKGGPLLGERIDREIDGQPTIGALGDDTDSFKDDEDGLMGMFLTGGSTPTGDLAAVALLEVSAELDAEPLLDGWMDFNGDGDWDDEGEQIFDSVAVSDGLNELEFAVPLGSTLETYARFRISSSGGLETTGLARDGEVEDYLVSLGKGHAGGGSVAGGAGDGSCANPVPDANTNWNVDTHVPSDGPATHISEGAQQEMAAAKQPAPKQPGLTPEEFQKLLDENPVKLRTSYFDSTDSVYRWTDTGEIDEFTTRNTPLLCDPDAINDPNVQRTRLQTPQPVVNDPARNAVVIPADEAEELRRAAAQGGSSSGSAAKGASNLDEAADAARKVSAKSTKVVLGTVAVAGDAYLVYNGFTNFTANAEQYGTTYACSQCVPVVDDIGNTTTAVVLASTTDWSVVTWSDVGEGLMEAPVVAVPVIFVQVAPQAATDPAVDVEEACREGLTEFIDGVAPGAIDTIGGALNKVPAIDSATDVITDDPKELKKAVVQAATDPDVDVEAACREGLTEAIESVPGGSTLIDTVGGYLGRTSIGRAWVGFVLGK